MAQGKNIYRLSDEWLALLVKGLEGRRGMQVDLK